MLERMYRYPKVENFGLILSASILPLYLSMFRYSAFGATLRLADLLLLVLIIVNFVKRPNVFYNLFQHRFIPAWIFLAYLLFNGYYHNDIGTAVKESIQLVWVLIYFVLVSFYAKNNNHKFLKYTVFFLVVSVLYTIMFHIMSGQYFGYKLAGDAKYAFGLLSLFMLLMGSVNRDKKTLKLFVITLVPLIMSLERKGIFGVVIALVVLFILCIIKAKPSKGEVKFLFISVIFLALSALYVFDFTSFINKEIYLSNFLDEEIALYTSNIHRENLLLNSYQIITQHPWLGVGADKITFYMFDYYWDKRLINGAHNFYVDTLVHYGVIGLFILITWSLHQIYVCFKSSVFHKELFCLYVYCIFVATFMSTGQAVLLIFLLPFLNPYIFLKS